MADQWELEQRKSEERERRLREEKQKDEDEHERKVREARLTERVGFERAMERLTYKHVLDEQKRNYQQLEEWNKNATEKKPLYVEAERLLKNAKEFQDLKQYRKALDCLTRAKQLLPDEPVIYHNLAILHRNFGAHLFENALYEEAEMQFRAAQGYVVDDESAQEALVMTLMQAGKIDAAMLETERLLHINPENAKAHTCRGIMYEQLMRYEDAAGEFRKATRLDPLSGDHRYRLALNCANLGHYHEAFTMLRDVEQSEEGLDKVRLEAAMMSVVCLVAQKKKEDPEKIREVVRGASSEDELLKKWAPFWASAKELTASELAQLSDNARQLIMCFDANGYPQE